MRFGYNCSVRETCYLDHNCSDSPAFLIFFLNTVKFCMQIIIKSVGFFPSGFRMLLLSLNLSIQVY